MIKKSKIVLPVLLLTVIVFLWQCGTITQTETGSISGVVFDNQGTTELDAKIYLHNRSQPNSTALMETNSSSDGSFNFVDVPAGHYLLQIIDRISKNGFIREIDIAGTVGGKDVSDLYCVLAPLGVVQGKLDTALVRSQNIEMVTALQIGASGIVKENGVFQITKLPAWTYKLQARASGQTVNSYLDSIEAVVEAGSTIDLVNKPDPEDFTLFAYYISPEEAQTFSSTDEQISPFWNQKWRNRDYIRMTPEKNTYEARLPFENNADANVIIKAAGNDEGLFLLIEVEDNSWTKPLKTLEGGAIDAVDLYFDPQSSEAIKKGAPDIYVTTTNGIINSTITRTTTQYQISLEDTIVKFSEYMPTFNSFSPTPLNFNQIRIMRGGMRFENIKIDSVTRAQEWYIPWTQIGLEGKPEVGTKIAFAGGYNDIDTPVLDSMKCLRWKKIDPATQPRDESNFPDAWGDIEIGLGFADWAESRQGQID